MRWRALIDEMTFRGYVYENEAMVLKFDNYGLRKNNLYHDWVPSNKDILYNYNYIN